MSNIYIKEPATLGKVVMHTTVGDLDVELFSREAPRASRRFVQLALEHYYDGAPFARVVRDFIVQIGDADSSANANDDSDADVPAISALQQLKAEFHSRIRFVRRGLVATAFDFSTGASNRDGTRVAAQFFFTLAQTPELERKHSIFGTVAGETLYNMLKLNDIELDGSDTPVKKHKINSIEVLSNPFEDIVPRPLALVRPDLHRVEQAAADRASSDASRGSKAVKNMKLLSFADEVDDSEADGASAQAEWSSSARRAAANKSKSSHDLLEDPELARDPAYDLAALQKQGAPGVRAPAAASEAGEKKSGGDKAGAAAAAGPAADDELEDDEAAEAKRKEEEKARIALEISKLQEEIVASKRAALKGSTIADRQEMEELEKKRKAAAERKLLLEDEYATLGGGRLGKLRSVSLARAAEALEEKESSAKKGRSDFAYVPGRYAGRGVSGGSGGSKQASSEREASTLDLLKQFESQLQSANQSEAPAETESQTTWLAHRLQFEREPTKPTSEGVEEPESLPLDASALSGAQASEQFYALDDPRNPLNVRRREGGTAAAGSRGVGGGLKRDGEKRDHGHSSHKKTKT